MQALVEVTVSVSPRRAVGGKGVPVRHNVRDVLCGRIRIVILVNFNLGVDPRETCQAGKSMYSAFGDVISSELSNLIEQGAQGRGR